MVSIQERIIVARLRYIKSDVSLWFENKIGYLALDKYADDIYLVD